MPVAASGVTGACARSTQPHVDLHAACTDALHRYKEGTDLSEGKDVFSSEAFVHVCLLHGVVPDALDPPAAALETQAARPHPRPSADIEEELWVLSATQHD